MVAGSDCFSIASAAHSGLVARDDTRYFDHAGTGAELFYAAIVGVSFSTPSDTRAEEAKHTTLDCQAASTTQRSKSFQWSFVAYLCGDSSLHVYLF